MPIMVSPHSVVFCKRNEGQQVPMWGPNSGGVCPVDHSEARTAKRLNTCLRRRVHQRQTARVRLVGASAPSCAAIELNGGWGCGGYTRGLGSISLPSTVDRACRASCSCLRPARIRAAYNWQPLGQRLTAVTAPWVVGRVPFGGAWRARLVVRFRIEVRRLVNGTRAASRRSLDLLQRIV